MNITIDFETQCRLSLRATSKTRSVGVENYVRHPTFRILCLGYKLGRCEPRLWIPGQNTRGLNQLYDAIRETHPIYAHNVNFERIVWRVMVEKYGAPEVPNTQWHDTAAMAAVCSLPRSLENVGEALKLKNRKDSAGHRSMLTITKPLPVSHRRKYGGAEFATATSHPEKFRETFAYCLDDVRAEHELIDAIPPLSKAERKVFLLDMRINDRGIPIDVENVKNAIEINEEIERRLLLDLDMVTEGEITSVNQNAKMLKYVNERGVNIDNLQKETIRDLFTQKEIHDMDPSARRVLEIRRAIGLASTAKYQAMLSHVSDDGRIRGTLLYHGANTGRWSGKGVQFHNLPSRDLAVSGSDVDISFAVSCLDTRNPDALEILYGDAPGALKALIRPMVKAPPGRKFYVADFAQIEARALAWLAGDKDALDAYRTGRDAYVELAAKIYDKPEGDVTKAERFMGKSAVLGLGYGMGADKFKLTLEKQDVWINQEFADRVVKIYRENRPLVVQLWRDVNNAAIKAVDEPGEVQAVGKLKFVCRDSRLWLILPCGRKLCYNSPEIRRTPVFIVCKKMEDGSNKFVSKHTTATLADRKVEQLNADILDEVLLTDNLVQVVDVFWFEGVDCELRFWSADSTTGKWASDRTYGPKLVENAAQAISRDFLVDSMFRLEAADYEVIFTVHDEIILETDEDFGSCKEVREIMEQPSAWSRGFPLEVEVFETKRYRK